MCKVCKAAPEDLAHAFFDCLPCKDTSALLLSYVSLLVPGITPKDILTLNFSTNVGESDILPTLVLIATGLRYIWKSRVDKKTVCQYRMRTEVEAKISILRKTRHVLCADRLSEIVS